MRSPTLLLLRLALAAATVPGQLLFNFTETRYPWAQYLQLSELRLYAANGSRIAIYNVSNPMGTAPYRTQMAVQVADGSVQTKWVDIGYATNGYSLLYLTPIDASAVAYCACSAL